MIKHLTYRFITVCLAGFLSQGILYAQDSLKAEPLRLHSTLYGVGHANILDSYLSPYSYTGTELRIIREAQRMTHLAKGRIAYQAMLDAQASLTTNPGGNVRDLAGGIRYSCSWLYGFTPQLMPDLRTLTKPALSLYAGLGASGYLGGVMNMRNGNNPAQLKLDVMIDLKAQASYAFRVKRRMWLARYQLAIPLLGAAFSPAYGQSYYEIFSLGNYDHNVVCANFVTMPSMRHLLTLDIPVGKNYLRLGWAGEFMQARFNGLRYHSYSNDFMIGFTKYFKRQ